MLHASPPPPRNLRERFLQVFERIRQALLDLVPPIAARGLQLVKLGAGVFNLDLRRRYARIKRNLRPALSLQHLTTTA